MLKEKKHLQKNFILIEFYIALCADRPVLNVGAIMNSVMSVDGIMTAYSIQIMTTRVAVTKKV